MNESKIRTTKTIIRALTAASFLFFVAYQLFLVTKIEEGRAGRIIGIVLFSLITIASFLSLTGNSAVRIVRIVLLTAGLGGTFLMKLLNIPTYFGALSLSYIPSVLRCAIYVFAQLGTLIILVYYLAIRRNQSIQPSTKRKAAYIMMSFVIVLFVLCLMMELVMMLKFGESITYSLKSTVISRFLYCFGFVGIAVGFMLPPSRIEDETEEYINKEQADADIMVISPENKKPRAEEERRRNMVIDDADIVMSPQKNKPRSEKNKPRNPVLDDNDFVFSTTENSRSSKKRK